MYDILIAEDSQNDIFLLEEALREHRVPCKLHIVGDGRKLINFLDQAGHEGGPPCPKLVILDWHLPLADEPRFVKQVTSHAVCLDVPVLVFTSSSSLKDREDALRSGARDYLQKPIGLDEFLAIGSVIRQMLGEPTPGPQREREADPEGG